MSTANVYGKATRTRTRNRRRFLVNMLARRVLLFFGIKRLLKTENNDRPKIIITARMVKYWL